MFYLATLCITNSLNTSIFIKRMQQNSFETSKSYVKTLSNDVYM